MRDSSILSFAQRPIVVLFANPSTLAMAFVETLIASFARVKIIADDVNAWQECSVHLKGNKSIEIVKSLSKKTDKNFNYVVFLHIDEEKIADQKKFLREKRRLEFALRIAEEYSIKILVILPYYQGEYENKLHTLGENALKREGLTAGLVCLGDLFGPRMSLAKESTVTRAIKDFLIKMSVTIPRQEEDLYPTFIADAAKELVRNLFSFGNIGETTLVFSEKMSSEKLAEVFKEIKPATSVIVGGKYREFIKPDVDRGINLKTNFKKALKETIDWFSKYQPQVKIDHQKTFTQKVSKLKLQVKTPKIKTTPKKWVWGVVFLIAFLLINPALLIISSSSLFVAKKQISAGNLSLAKIVFSISSISSGFVYKEGEIFSRTPVLGQLFKPVVYTSSLLQRLSHLGKRAILVSEYSTELAQKILGDASYEQGYYSEKIALELDFAYREIGFLQSELEDEVGISRKISEVLLKNNLDLPALRQKVLIGKKIAESLPVVLGAEKATSYLILFQNNMELRPTGGFIGSFALVSFEAGRLIDVRVLDVYTADGQLRGHVEPPVPIKEYLGEASWFLRDSNWDRDFPTSAAISEWFLEKEIDESVDGVIGVDLEVARRLVAGIGPLYISDFDKEVDSNNLYEVTQYEVEKDFFPGSQKKATFLTALSRELLAQLINLHIKDYYKVGKTIFDSLEEKHIQVFLHDRKVQRAFSDVGWDGGVYQPVCSGNCFSDWLGIVDANIGVNKANYSVERQASLAVILEEGSIKRHLTVFLDNEANPALGSDARYKSYLRVLAPQDSLFSDIEIFDSTGKEFVAPEIEEIRARKEAGVLIEVGPGQSKSVTFVWEESSELSFNEAGEYRLYWRKQAGTIADPISLKFVLPEQLQSTISPTFSLTAEGDLGYNTNLARDFSSRIFW